MYPPNHKIWSIGLKWTLKRSTKYKKKNLTDFLLLLKLLTAGYLA